MVRTYKLGSNGDQAVYGIFARTSNFNDVGNCGATLLVTDCGNFGGTLTGAWLVQLSNRRSTPTMSVTTLQPPNNSGTVDFGYYTDGSYFYFGVYTQSYAADRSITVLRSNQVALQDFGDLTAKPSDWTAVTPRVIQVQ